MAILSFGSYRPDVSDYEGTTNADVLNVVPRGDGYGPFLSHVAYTASLPSACRGFFYARKSDGSIAVFASTSTDLFLLNNTTFLWTPVSKPQTLTSISNATPAVVGKVAHGYSAGDPIVFSTTGTLPSPIVAGTIYYVISAGLTADQFEFSATSGGAAVNTTSAGSGTHSATSHYSAVSSTANWQFAQFNNFVVAVQINTPPQVYDLTSSSAFADLGGSPPQASYVSVVNRFIVLSGLAAPNVYRVQWSGLNTITQWTSGVSQSDYQDLPDGGIVRGIAGGEFGLIFQDTSIRRMTFSPGSPYVFGIDRISQDDGLFAPYSLVSAGDRVLFCSPQGFKMLLPGGYPTPIGKERVDRTFFADIDTSNLQLMIGANDPKATRAYWAYKSINGAVGKFDKILSYDWALDRWTPITVSGEYLTSLSKPGLTLEGVNAAYGSNIDTLTIDSLDSISSSVLAQLSSVNGTHSLGFFSGESLESLMETSEHGGGDGRRVFVRGYRPVSDAPTIYGSVGNRETLRAPRLYSTESLVNAIGQCPARVSTRYYRAKIRIPAGTSWTFAAGVEPDTDLEGEN